MFLSTELAGRFGLGLGVSTVLGWILLRWVGPWGLMDIPGGRRSHKEAVPRTGGLAFVFTMLLGLVFAWYIWPFTPLQWAGLIAMAVMGLADDRFQLRARYKAFVGFSVAVALAYTTAFSLLSQQLEIHLLGGELPNSFWTYFALLVPYYWCVPQSFNLIDGVNGLAMGYAVVVLSALGLSGYFHPYTAGAVTGLLVWNWPRARHFLGDCGSMSLGLLLALMVKNAYGPKNPNLILWIFAYPFLDTTMVVAVRLWRGEHPASADRGHLHHHWQSFLVGREAWVAPIILLQAAACASAVIVRGWGWIIPCSGLAALVFQAFWFSITNPAPEKRGSPRSIPNKDI